MTSRGCVGCLRALAATGPDAPDRTAVVGELLVKARTWPGLRERYDGRGHSCGRKTFHHPDVGNLTPGYQITQVVGTRAQQLITCHAEPGTAGHGALVLPGNLGAHEPAPLAPGHSQ